MCIRDSVNLRSALSVKSNTTDWKWVEDLYCKFEDKVVALHVAASNGHHECVKALLDVGVNANISTRCNDWDKGLFRPRTPLYFSAFHGHISIVALLIERGAGIDIKCYDELETFCGNFKAIDVAACYNHTDVVKLLYNHGANMTNACLLYTSPSPRD